MIPYSLHVAIILAICLIFYKLLLQKETYYRLNRVILLLCLILAFILPLIPVPQKYSLRHETEVIKTASSSTVNPEPISAFKEQQNEVIKLPAEQANPSIVAKVPLIERLMVWAFWLYWCGVAILAINLIIQLSALFFQAYGKPVIKDGIYRIIELDNDKAPCSFGNMIFINPSKYDWDTYNQIVMHEKVHIKQGHSFDLILAELVLVVQWYNPFAWLYRKELESNLEFLADDSVLQNNEIEREGYQLSLLKVAVPNQAMSITINYNQSMIKKRIVMMNAKKSNVHMMWKYFIMLPLMMVLLCGLNKPVAVSSTPTKKEPAYFTDNEEDTSTGNIMPDKIDGGQWFGIIKDGKIKIEAKSPEYADESSRWTKTVVFNLSEFSPSPLENKTSFTLTRETGVMSFTGKFEDNQGFGRFTFERNENFKAFLSFKGFDFFEESEYMSLFFANTKKLYIQSLYDNGLKKMTKKELALMVNFNINEEYINFWRRMGFTSLTPYDLSWAKSLKIDSIYVTQLRKIGYNDLTMQDLINLKSNGVTVSYINSLQKAKLTKSVPGKVVPAMAAERLSSDDIIDIKLMGIDTNYIATMRNFGFQDLTLKIIKSLKSEGITPEFIRNLQELGIRNLNSNALLALKLKGITPEFVKSYQEVGLINLSLAELSALKNQKISPEYIKGFQEIGLKDIQFNTLSSFKTNGITADYVKGFIAIGYKNTPYNQYITLKSQGITPEFVAEMKQKGFESKDLSKYIQLKSFN